MPYMTKYHIAEQNAYALLGPVRDSLEELERRTQHYVERLAMDEADREALTTASRAVAAARVEVERLRQAGAPGPLTSGNGA